MKEKILFVDDDPEIREVVEVLLASEGYDVTVAANGAEFFEKMNPNIDLVILDIMMPGMNGYTICTRLRKDYSVPVLFLTAKSLDGDKLMGFSVGGDDYLVKPFSYNDLILKVKSLIRRYKVYGTQMMLETDSVIECCEHIRIDNKQKTVFYDDEEIYLTDLEYRILYLLASHKKQVFSAQHIYESVWEEPYCYTSNNTIMVHIANIRKKLRDDPKNIKTIRTVWGRGYRIE